MMLQKRGNEAGPKSGGKGPPAEGHMGREQSWHSNRRHSGRAPRASGSVGGALQRSYNGVDHSRSVPPRLWLSAVRGLGLCCGSPL